MLFTYQVGFNHRHAAIGLHPVASPVAGVIGTSGIGNHVHLYTGASFAHGVYNMVTFNIDVFVNLVSDLQSEKRQANRFIESCCCQPIYLDPSR